MAPVYTLVFEIDNPCNTNIIDSDTGKTLYYVATEHGKDSVTRVKNASGETIASWVWRDVRSDIITLGNTSPTPVSTWLRKSLVPFKDTVTFQDYAGRGFKWKGNGPGLSLELFAQDNKREPLARFRKSRTRTSEPARLLLDNRGLEIQDLVVISFLVLEKSRRARENSTIHRANALAVPPSGAVSGL